MSPLQSYNSGPHLHVSGVDLAEPRLPQLGSQLPDLLPPRRDDGDVLLAQIRYLAHEGSDDVYDRIDLAGIIPGLGVSWTSTHGF